MLAVDWLRELAYAAEHPDPIVRQEAPHYRAQAYAAYRAEYLAARRDEPACRAPAICACLACAETYARGAYLVEYRCTDGSWEHWGEVTAFSVDRAVSKATAIEPTDVTGLPLAYRARFLAAK
jgi:hypothetical protein